MTINKTKRGSRLAFGRLICALAPFSLGYFLSYLLRGANGIIEQDLVVDIGLSPAELGLVTAAYLGAFAVFQLPLGIFVDKYGPWRVPTALLSVATVGTLLFSMSQSVEALTAGRAVIGLGFARDTAMEIVTEIYV